MRSLISASSAAPEVASRDMVEVRSGFFRGGLKVVLKVLEDDGRDML
jgi:hypothetical protein